LWACSLISLPIVGWVLGETALKNGMSLGVILQAAAVLFSLAAGWGWRATLQTFGLVALLSFLAEWLGSSSGFPFGRYSYTALLQPQLFGVPLLIPLAWMMMLPPAWAIGRLSAQRLNLPHLHWLLAALAFTAWDLFLDPQMTAWGFWVWHQPGAYFDIPLVNYLGWALVSSLITLAVRPSRLPIRPLAVIYSLTWGLQSIGQAFFWHQPGPALAGFLACGLFVVLAWPLHERKTA